MKEIKQHKKHIIILLLLIFTVFSVWMNNKYFMGHDTRCHFPNIIALSKTINFKNLIGYRIYPFVGNNFGYGTGIFYPVFADYIPSLIFKIISPITSNVFYAIKIYYILTMSVAAIGMYIASYKLSKSKYVALISSSLYMFMPYFLSDIFVRDAIGETAIFAVLPFIFLSFSYLKEEKYQKFLLTFSFSYIIGMKFHLVMMIYVSIIVLIYFIFNYKILFKKKTLLYLIISSIIILIAASPEIVRILQSKQAANYIVFEENSMSSVDGLKYHSLNISDYIVQSEHHDNIWLCLNPVGIFLFMFSLAFINNLKIDKDQKKQFYFSCTTIIVLIFMMSELMPWGKLPSFLYNIQFPWRMDMILAFIISYVSPMIILNIKEKDFQKYTTYGLVFITAIIGIKYIHFNSDVEMNYKEPEWNIAMGWSNEYLPVNTNLHYDYFLNRDENILCSQKCDIKIINNDVPNMSFFVTKTQKKNIIEIPRLYYLGYKIYDPNNKVLKYYENENGFISFEINKPGKYKIKYSGTKMERLSKILSFIVTVGLIIYYPIIKKGKQNEKKD